MRKLTFAFLSVILFTFNVFIDLHMKKRHKLVFVELDCN